MLAKEIIVFFMLVIGFITLFRFVSSGGNRGEEEGEIDRCDVFLLLLLLFLFF